MSDWDRRWAERGLPTQPPAELLLAWRDQLPRTGRALDVAAGNGTQSLWLAAHGLDVTATDASAVGLSLAQEAAQQRGLPLRTHRADLEAEGLPAALVGPWDVITCIHYLQVELFEALRAALAPGGLLLFAQPSVHNLARHDRPSRRFLLDPDRLPQLAGSLEVLCCDAAWRTSGRHEAWLVARRPA